MHAIIVTVFRFAGSFLKLDRDLDSQGGLDFLRGRQPVKARIIANEKSILAVTIIDIQRLVRTVIII